MKKKQSIFPTPNIAIVSANWHRDIVDQALKGIRNEFKLQGVPTTALKFFDVPGVFEIPLYAKSLAKSGRFQGIIACGLIVNGGIYRHEFVSTAVIDGLMQVQLSTDVPVFSAVLTPHFFHEHEDHQSFFKGHFLKKGQEVASACLQTISGLGKVANLRSVNQN
jgi:6,7-dimethyl-8-ribityllumazine synthase